MADQSDRSKVGEGETENTRDAAVSEIPERLLRQVVIDVLATAIVDLLVKDRLHIRGDNEATPC